MKGLNLPELVYQDMPDGKRIYFYINTTAEREAKFRYQVYLDDIKRNNKNCSCPICTGELSF